MSSDSTIDYEALTQEAMRGVVRRVLQDTAKLGLPGEHHFYVSFDTLAPGVVLSKRLRDKYAEEMTIVLQHRFWDLEVGDERFEVKLTFDGIPERLVVPFTAIKVFFDPSVRYGLLDMSQSDRPNPVMVDRGDVLRPDGGTYEDLVPDHPVPGGEIGIAALNSSADDAGASPGAPKIVASSDATAPPVDDPIPDDGEDDAADAERGSAEIVSLDAFRKK